MTLASANLPFIRSLLRSERVSDREIWLKVATDCLVNGVEVDPVLSAELMGAYSTCLRSVGAEAQAAAAETILKHPAPPVRLVAIVAQSGGPAANRMLAEGRGVGRELLARTALSPLGARLIAGRADLDARLVGEVLALDDFEASLALARNGEAPLGAAEIRRLAILAREAIALSGDRRLAEALLARTPLRVETAALFLEATPPQRAQLLLAAQRAELGSRVPLDIAPSAQSRIEALERFALANMPTAFAATLADALGCTPALADRIAADPAGEPLAVALAAIGAPRDVSVRILTAGDLRDGTEYRRVATLARLQDRLSLGAARQVMTAVAGTQWSAAPVEKPELPPQRAPRPAPESRPAELSPAKVRRRRAFGWAESQRL